VGDDAVQHRKKVSAIIVAAGKGKRMERNYNKQYIKLEGVPILAHTVIQFENHPKIDEILIVVGQGEVKFCNENIVVKNNLTKVKKIVEGGKERYHSVYNGIKAVSEECDLVLIHDGARPFITAEVINESIESATVFGSSIVGVPVKDTIKVIDEEGYVKDTPKRENLWQVQTPQTFQKDLVLQAHRKREKENLTVTDDAMLVEALGRRVKMIRGDYENIKITTPEDLELGQVILKRRKINPVSL
jgi:2-C-methyl-D-erythritol 4-phosphate cytidylyltransferase